MAAPNTPIVLGKGDALERLQEKGVLITDGNKMSDKTTTIYRMKSKANKLLCMQFGTGLGDLAPCSIVSFVDNEDATQRRKICFVNMDENKKAWEELDACSEAIGKQLFEGRQVYWGGRCKDDMTFEEFMEKKSAIVKPNKVTGSSEAVVKCPEKLSRFWHMSDLSQKEDGQWKFTRRPISRFSSSSRAFTGLLSCNVGLYTGWNKGPTWGVYLNVRDALLVPVDMSGKKAASSMMSMDFGGAAEQVDELDTKMVVDMDGGHEEGSSDLEGEEESGGKRGMAPGFVEPPTLKRTKRV